MIALCMEIEMRRFEWRGLLLMILTPLYLLRLWFRIYNPFNWRKPRRFWRETFLPFLAGRYSRDEVVAAYRDGIDMDPDTELAVEAGKEIARLK